MTTDFNKTTLPLIRLRRMANPLYKGNGGQDMEGSSATWRFNSQYYSIFTQTIFK